MSIGFKMAKKNQSIPFHEREYFYDKETNQYFPFLEITIISNKSRKKILALADTGCTSCIHLCKSYVEDEGLILGEKINRDPISVSVADGHTINADLYRATCEIDGNEQEVIISVIDPERFFQEEETDIKMVEPLLGRGVLDNFDVMFKGRKKNIAIFRSE
jgi:predicted aspartyl protease